MQKKEIFQFINKHLPNSLGYLDLVKQETVNDITDPRYKNVYLIKNFNDNIDISDILDILIGCILGDATFINKYTIKFEQGYKNRIYLFYLFTTMFCSSKKMANYYNKI